MKITALVENRSNCELKAVHGLSLYIETERYRLLFDLGPDDTLFRNAEGRGIDLGQVDAVVISLEINHTARIYVQRRAFEKHFSKALGMVKVPIGLDRKLMEHPQMVLTDGDRRIDEELLLFTVEDTSKYPSPANRTLYDEKGPDTFAHEQNLMIFGEKNVLVMGCGHCGVVNILERAKAYRPDVCVGGYHLTVPAAKKTVPAEVLEGITGEEAYRYLADRVPGMRYLSCGESIVV